MSEESVLRLMCRRKLTPRRVLKALLKPRYPSCVLYGLLPHSKSETGQIWHISRLYQDQRVDSTRLWSWMASSHRKFDVNHELSYARKRIARLKLRNNTKKRGSETCQIWHKTTRDCQIWHGSTHEGYCTSYYIANTFRLD